jgi:hypothetical protein
MAQLLVDIVLMIAIPWLLRFIYQRFSRPKSNANTPKPANQPTKWTRLDYAIHALLAITLLWSLHALFWKPPADFFSLIDAPCTDPNFLVRNRFRAYADQQRRTDPQFDEPQAGLRWPRWRQGDPEGDVSQFEFYSALFELLKSTSNRHVYLMYGQDALAQCSWCVDEYDYMLYAIPSVLMQYFIAMIVVGSVTSTSKKSILRMWLVWMMMSLLSTEIMMYLIPAEYFPEVFGVKYLPIFQYCHIARHACISLVMVMAFFWNRERAVDRERVEMMEIMKSVEEDVVLMKMNRLQKMVIFEDEDLTRQYVTHLQQHRQERMQVHADPNVQQMREQLLSQQPPEAMQQMADSLRKATSVGLHRRR